MTLEQRKAENKELWDRLVSAYGDKHTSVFSDWSGAIAQDEQRWNDAISRQDVFTADEVIDEYARIYNEWLAKTNAEYERRMANK